MAAPVPRRSKRSTGLPLGYDARSERRRDVHDHGFGARTQGGAIANRERSRSRQAQQPSPTSQPGHGDRLSAAPAQSGFRSRAMASRRQQQWPCGDGGAFHKPQPWPQAPTSNTFQPQAVIIARTGTVTWSFGSVSTTYSFPAPPVRRKHRQHNKCVRSRTFNTRELLVRLQSARGMTGIVYVVEG